VAKRPKALFKDESPKLPHAEACPFCGKAQPVKLFAGNKAYVCHVNDKCAAAGIIAAVERWNARASSRQDGVQHLGPAVDLEAIVSAYVGER
jgi:hypothetical protein